jgi:hypothetical protein
MADHTENEKSGERMFEWQQKAYGPIICENYAWKELEAIRKSRDAHTRELERILRPKGD